MASTSELPTCLVKSSVGTSGRLVGKVPRCERRKSLKTDDNIDNRAFGNHLYSEQVPLANVLCKGSRYLTICAQKGVLLCP